MDLMFLALRDVRNDAGEPNRLSTGSKRAMALTADSLRVADFYLSIKLVDI
jgi:hypothetical protein